MLSKTGFGRNPLRKMSSLPASFAYSGSCPGGLDKLGTSKSEQWWNSGKHDFSDDNTGQQN